MNLNTPEYWDDVYRGECERGEMERADYRRDYGPIHDSVVALVPDRSRVLDLGCGPGLLCRRIKRARPGAAVTGVDFSPWVIEHNRRVEPELGIEYVCLDVRDGLGQLAPDFDVVTMCEVLEHLEEPERVVGEAVGLLRAGGRLVVTCPNGDAVPSPEHVRLWGHDDLAHLLEPYGSAVTFVHFPPPYFDKWLLAFIDKAPEGGAAESVDREVSRLEQVIAVLERNLARADRRDAERRLREVRERLEETERRLLVLEVREAVRRAVPAHACILVVSRGDDELLELDGHTGWHFPQSGGSWGGYPGSSREAVAHLEELRGRGGEFVVFPSAAFWWLDHYEGFRRYLDECHRRVWADERCVVYDLRTGPG